MSRTPEQLIRHLQLENERLRRQVESLEQKIKTQDDQLYCARLAAAARGAVVDAILSQASQDRRQLLNEIEELRAHLAYLHLPERSSLAQLP